MNAFSRTPARSARGALRLPRFLRWALILPLSALAVGCAQQQGPDLQATIVAQSTVLAKLAETPTPTNTPPATATPLPTATATPEPEPTATSVSPPTSTPVPRPRATDTPAPTATPTVDPALRAAMLTFYRQFLPILNDQGSLARQYNEWLGTLSSKPPAQQDAEFGWYRNEAEELYLRLQSVPTPEPLANVKSLYLAGLKASMDARVLSQRARRENNPGLNTEANAKTREGNELRRQALAEFNQLSERYGLGVPCLKVGDACA